MTTATKPGKAVAYARLFGPHDARTPQGLPIMLAAPPFDPEVTKPWEAMAATAKQYLGIGANPAHWQVEHEYTVKDSAVTLLGRDRTKGKPPYTRVFVLNYLPEQPLRAKRGVDETTVHKFLHPGNSWYTEIATDAETTAT
jgi:hypothetical protein